MAEQIFVYGTLRPGSGHAMGAWLGTHASLLGPAKVRGRLLHVSYYPGLVPGTDWALGEVLTLDPACATAILAKLDAFEDCRGRDDDEFHRKLSQFVLEDGGSGEAWVYWYQGDTRSLLPVAGGDWLASQPAVIQAKD